MVYYSWSMQFSYGLMVLNERKTKWIGSFEIKSRRECAIAVNRIENEENKRRWKKSSFNFMISTRTFNVWKNAIKIDSAHCVQIQIRFSWYENVNKSVRFENNWTKNRKPTKWAKRVNIVTSTILLLATHLLYVMLWWRNLKKQTDAYTQ